MSDNRILREIEKLIEEENRKEKGKKIEMSSSLRDAAKELEERLDQARYEYGKVKDYLPSELRDEMISFVKRIADITRY